MVAVTLLALDRVLAFMVEVVKGVKTIQSSLTWCNDSVCLTSNYVKWTEVGHTYPPYSPEK